MLQSLNVKVDTALSGMSALNQMQERMELMRIGKAQMYKIILLDYSMPELDGPEVAMRIRRLFQSNPLLEEDAVPFICCCTAYDEASFKRQALAAGMDQFMTKPLKLDELKQILEILK